MTPLATFAATIGIIAVAAIATIGIIGLCRAAADLRDVEPDNGEYDE